MAGAGAGWAAPPGGGGGRSGRRARNGCRSWDQFGRGPAQLAVFVVHRSDDIAPCDIAIGGLAARCRRQGVGRTLMSRALEICARSLVKHVMLSVEPGNVAAQALYARIGLRKIGEIVSYHALWPRASVQALNYSF